MTLVQVQCTVKSVLNICVPLWKEMDVTIILFSLHSSARQTQLLYYFSLINVLVSPLQKPKHGFIFK